MSDLPLSATDPVPTLGGAAAPGLVLDGQELPFQPGQTILEAALAAGRFIPHLCFHPDFGAHGSCRLCTVRVDGRPVAACTVQAVAGQVVDSDVADLNLQRRTLLQMLFVEGNHFCPSCEASGNCQLQALAYAMGMTGPHFEELYPQREVDASHPDVWLDRNRCILCELCVRASREADGKGVFAIGGHGLQTHLVVGAASGRLGDTCVAVQDRAVAVCPVGALLPKRRGFVQPIGARRYDSVAINGQPIASRQTDAEPRTPT